MTGRAAARYWLKWAVISSLALGIAYVVGFILSIFVALIPFAAGGASFGFPIGVATVCLVIGAIVGSCQSPLLPWTPTIQNRWVRQSFVGWTVGGAVGGVVGMVVASLIFGTGGRRSAFAFPPYSLELASPVIGLVVGWMLRSVPPCPPVRLSWWLAAHAIAVSGGWIAARLVAGESLIAALIFGAPCYGIVSGLAMLTVIRDRQASPTDEMVDSDVA